MYSTLPVKPVDWRKDNMRYSMVFFPFVSMYTSAAQMILWWLCRQLNVTAGLFGILSVIAVVLTTGGIHFDGFCDTADALYSRRPKEEKLKILKDPNCGAFAVLSIVLVILLQANTYSQIYSRYEFKINFLLFGVMFISRTLSGISVLKFPYTETSSLAKTFGGNASKRAGNVLLCEYILISLILVMFFGLKALLIIFLSICIFTWYYFMQKKEFGGITGDLAGFFLVITESICNLVIAVSGGTGL